MCYLSAPLWQEKKTKKEKPASRERKAGDKFRGQRQRILSLHPELTGVMLIEGLVPSRRASPKDWGFPPIALRECE